MTNSKEGSQFSFKTRKAETLEGFVIPAKTSPTPKIIPVRNEIAYSFLAGASRARSERMKQTVKKIKNTLANGICPGPGMIAMFGVTRIFYWIIALAVGQKLEVFFEKLLE
eukprot:Pompholyxophrys_punicea_v1_NODE_555_length_1697_cov_4.718636.p1 type:complete len:111 gc:universal NODE_555_length_1697_cov_4.718636:1577-1245(-)